MLITTTVPPFTLLHTLKCVFIPVNLSLGVVANICQTVWLTTIKNLIILLEGSMSFKMHTQKGGGVGWGDTDMFFSNLVTSMSSVAQGSRALVNSRTQLSKCIPEMWARGRKSAL